MSQINFFKIDNNYVGFRGNREILHELRSKYSFHTKNYKWDKRYKLGYWDGKISMLNLKDMRMYAGLLPEVKRYLEEEAIPYTDSSGIAAVNDWSEDDVLNLYKEIKGPFVPREDQVDAVLRCINEGRNIVLAPTSNGKSYIIHGINSYYRKNNLRVLIVIHRANLVMQLKDNFVNEYGAAYTVSTIYDDNNDTDCTISTWQSLKDADQSWFKQFDVIIADEVHTFKAKSLVNLIDKCGHMEFRHGFTATLDNDSETDALTLEGMFGKPHQTITLKEQIEQGISARPIVYVVMIKYPVTERRELLKDIDLKRKEMISQGKKPTEALAYQVESETLENHEFRNNLIAKIAANQKGNTLVAFKNHKHGVALREIIEKNITDKPIFFSNSTVSKEKRFEIQKIISGLTESIGVVSFGTFSTGINIVNLNNLIIGTQLKSKISIPQLIGRMVRITKTKKTTNIIDICDDLSHNNKKNVFYKHFEERMKFYLQNNFEIRTKVVTIA